MDYSSAYVCDEEDDGDDSALTKPRFLDLRCVEAEYFNKVLDCHLPNDVLIWNCDDDIGCTFELEELVLEIEDNVFEPISVRVSSGSMPRANINPLRKELRGILSLRFDSGSCVLEFAITLLQLTEEAIIHIHEWKNRWHATGPERGWNVNKVRRMEAIFNNPLGTDLETVDDSAFHLLGKSVKELCEDLKDQEWLRIVHVEPVLRSDLLSRFRERQRDVLDQLMKCTFHELRKCVSRENIPTSSSLNNRDDLARELCRPRGAFHGTLRWNIPSIVRHGFIVPDQKAGQNKVEVRSGSSFGKCIYMSPDPGYAMAYSRFSDNISAMAKKTRRSDLPSLRLIICAVLMGRPFQVTPCIHERPPGKQRKLRTQAHILVSHQILWNTYFSIPPKLYHATWCISILALNFSKSG